MPRTDPLLTTDLLDAIADGIQLWTQQGDMLAMNAASPALFGLADAEAADAEALLDKCSDADGRRIRDARGWIKNLADQDGAEALLKVNIGETEIRWLRLSARLVNAQADAPIVSTCFDVTRFMREASTLQRQAQYDALTNLPNRALFADRLHQALAHAQRRQETLAVCMLDLDGFKLINDRLGHKAGDRLLQEVAYRLQTLVRDEDTAARLGGDEFALLINGLHGSEECEQILNRVLQKLALPVVIEGQCVNVTASIGVSLYPGDLNAPDPLLRHADQAMYKAKEAGKGCFHIFNPAVAGKMQASQRLLKKIVDALDQGQFELHYQPLADCRNGNIVGLEALVRWRHPVLGMRRPGEFLPLIEKEDTIIQLGEWVIQQVLAQISAWQAAGLDLPVNVNISARHFLQGNFGARLEAMLAQHAPSCARRLGIEIVETAVLEDINAVSRLIHRYHDNGVTFSLDDFGAGYSSLVHLKRLAADALKIDQSFVRNMLTDPGDLSIVQAVINLARAFKLRVVAEGVETIERLLTLIELGCEVMQGYAIARPMPADRVVEWVRNFAPDPRWQLANSNLPGRDDFECLLGKVTHRHWYQSLETALLRGDDADWPELDAAHCRLGQWCETTRRKYPELQADIAVIEAIHQELHQLAQRLHDDRPAPPAERSALQEAVRTASDRLLQAIDACRETKH